MDLPVIKSLFLLLVGVFIMRFHEPLTVLVLHTGIYVNCLCTSKTWFVLLNVIELMMTYVSSEQD